VKFSAGLIIQWGVQATINYEQVNFPIVFTKKPTVIESSDTRNTSGNNDMLIWDITTTGFKIGLYGDETSVCACGWNIYPEYTNWLAIGF
jgi:hypothetical protein